MSAEAKEEASSEEKAEEPVEKQFKTSIKPHTFEVKVNEKLNNVRLLNDEQLKAAKGRIKALERRDKNKLELDEAKNYFETQIYELRAWLNDDANSVYSTESDKETWLSKCSEEEEWLDMEGFSANKGEFKQRGKALAK